MQIQTLYEDISSFSLIKLKETKARLLYLENTESKNANDAKKKENVNTTSDKRKILKNLEEIIPENDVDDNLTEKCISALDNSSTHLEILSELLINLHSKIEILNEAKNISKQNKELLEELAQSLESNLQIMLSNAK